MNGRNFLQNLSGQKFVSIEVPGISLSDCLPDHSQIDAQARAYLPAKHIQAVNECEGKQSNNDAKVGIG